MKASLVDVLICPSCLPVENALTLRAGQAVDDDILEGELSCGFCGGVFPVQEGLADLDPGRQQRSASRYEMPAVLSSYLWSHFGDLLPDRQASDAYARWADLVQPHTGFCLDIGAAVGRFSFEMARKCDFVVGLDNSRTFIRTARELLRHRRKTLMLPDEGQLYLEVELPFPDGWRTDNMEFIIGDAQALPFRSHFFSSVASLNMVDKLTRPLAHLQESSRVAKDKDAQFLLSDPFSWSAEAASEDRWLGGLADGPFAGHGLDNIIALLREGRKLPGPAWTIARRDSIWWKIRTHSNHFELIRSCCVKADR